MSDEQQYYTHCTYCKNKNVLEKQDIEFGESFCQNCQKSSFFENPKEKTGYIESFPKLNFKRGVCNKRRFFAAAIDNLLAIIPSVFVIRSFPEDQEITAFFISSFIYLFYFFIQEYVSDSTIGKKLFSLKIISKNGQRLSFFQIFVRTMLRFIEFNPFLLGPIIGYASVYFSKDKQRLGDKFAKTVVIFSK